MAPRPSPYQVEQQLAAELERVTNAQERAILAAWALAWSEISGDLFDTLNDVLAGGAITAATIVRSERLARMLALVADRLDDLAEQAGITITDDLDDVLARGVDSTARLIAAQLRDIDLDQQPTARALEAIVRRTTEQITSTLIPVADETYAVIQRELIRGVAVGDNPRETARRMVARSENLWNFGANRATTIARTEVLDSYREAARVSEDLHSDVLAGWVWLCHLGPRTCRSCLANHGRLHPLDEAGPKDHQQGRCSRCPVVRGEDGSVDLSWVPSADDHFADLSADEQRAILGRRGYRAWVAGKFPREQWTKTRSTDGWRDSQVAAAPGDAGAGSGLPPDSPAPPGGDGGDEPPFDFKGEVVTPREVDFVERFLASGEHIEWIARGSNGHMPDGRTRATNDFVWLSNGDIEVELKSPEVLRYENARRLIADAVRGAIETGVAKRNFIVDLGHDAPPAELLEQLRRYNIDRTRYQIARLWVFWARTLREITLDT